jgi:hypothetical protein
LRAILRAILCDQPSVILHIFFHAAWLGQNFLGLIEERER